MIDTKERLQNEIDNLKEEKKSSRREHKKPREKLEEQIRQEQQSREAAENSKRVLEGALDLATKKNNEMEKRIDQTEKNTPIRNKQPPSQTSKTQDNTPRRLQREKNRPADAKTR